MALDPGRFNRLIMPVRPLFYSVWGVAMFRTNRCRPHAQAQSYAPDVLAGLYNFPAKLSGTPPPIDLVELGGGFDLATLYRWCDARGYPHPTVNALSVAGGQNAYTGNPQSADGEVMGDLSVATGVLARAYPGQSATLNVLFCPNTLAGFQAGVIASTNALSCSWGVAEVLLPGSAMAAMQAALAARTKPVCASSGDAGANDGTRVRTLDFFASSPNVLSCGGSSILTAVVNGVLTITNESVWNASGGASGGGYSTVFKMPFYQQGFLPTGQTMRAGPDLVMAADPASAWDTAFGPEGGTSMVAPAMTCLMAIINQQLALAGKPLMGLPHPLLYANEGTCFRDITAGNNGAYSATKGFDAASGLGAPDGLAILKMFLAGNPATPPAAQLPVQVPAPRPPSVPGALYDGTGKMVYIPVTAA